MSVHTCLSSEPSLATLSVTAHRCGCGGPGARFKVLLKLVVILSASESSQVVSPPWVLAGIPTGDVCGTYRVRGQTLR